MNLSITALSAIALILPAHADITWTGAVSGDIMDVANWDLTQSTVTTLAPNVSITDNVVIRNAPATITIPDFGGQQRFQVGEGFTMTIDNSQVIALGNDGIGSDQGTLIGIDLDIINGALFEPFFVVNEVRVNIDATSTVNFGGAGNPVNLSTVDLLEGATLLFALEDPAAYTSEHLSKTTVDSMPAVIGVNLDVVSDGGSGSIVTVIPTVIGTPYCMANMNSTGGTAAMSASGSVTVANNNLTLECSDMPQNSFAFFQTSLNQGFVANPGGSEGNLCLGGSIGRFVGPGQVQNAGTAAAVALQFDLTQTPTPNGFVSIAAGETWNFQCWFRDTGSMGQAVSNFSNGLEVMFL